ncbi:MAG: carbohydrate ABC transporter permease [Anaerolineae bacterium]
MRSERFFQKLFDESIYVVVLGVLVVFAAFPLLWILMTSFKPNSAIISETPIFVFQPTLEHWERVLVQTNFLVFYRNSLIIAFGTVIVNATAGTMAAYALARGGLRYQENIAYFILSQRMLPAVAVVLPIFILASGIRALDHYETLIFINVAFNLPLSIWLIRSFVEGLPVEIEEAAVVDGASWLGALVRVTLPQMRPAIFSSMLLTYIYTVNEFLFALILSGSGTRPVSVAVQQFLPTGVRGTLFGEAAAASILIMLPGLILAVILQRYLVAGISLGAVKG